MLFVIRRFALGLAPWALLLSLPVHALGANADAVRLLDSHADEVFRQGVTRSPSFRALVDRLAASDVVVYIRYEDLPRRLAGRLRFMGSAGGRRYVVVSVSWHGSGHGQVAALAHELQHAVEVAETPGIVDQRSLRQAYTEIGYATDYVSGRVWFESAAAIDAGDRVLRELRRPAGAD